MKMNNKTMRFASLLLVLVLVTCAFVGGTFAKYTTKGDATDSARVAKWGVTVKATNDSGFKEEYAKTAETSFEQTVIAEENVVAPGTSGTLTDVTLSGSPEVAVKVSYAAELTLSNWTIDEAEYCPLEITVEGTKYTCTGTVAEFEAAVEAAIAACSEEYAANTDLSTAGTDAPSVSWSWAFEGNDDVKDTALGDQAVNGTAATIKLELTTTVTQID